MVDISDPSNPRAVGACEIAGDAFGIYIAGGYGYVASFRRGLTVVDVSDPFAPIRVGRCTTRDRAGKVWVQGSYAYVADGLSGLQIIDVSDPSHPVLICSYDTPDEALGVFVQGTRAYIADHLSGIHVVDVSDPFHPSRVASYDTPGSSHDVWANGDRIYVADKHSLMVLRCTETTSVPTEEGDGSSSDPSALSPSGRSLAPTLRVHPNPFNGVTSMLYRLAIRSTVCLEIYDVSGRRTRTLAKGEQHAGCHRVSWDGKDESGRDVSSGVYLCRLWTEGTIVSRKLVLLR